MAKDNISWWLDAIENKELVLPEFQREFTWSKDQIKTLVDSMVNGDRRPKRTGGGGKSALKMVLP